MGYFKADERYIVSVYPMKPTPVGRPYGENEHGGGRWTVYEMDACPRGADPVVLTVRDGFQRNHLDPDQQQMVPVDDIVHDLLRQWTANFVGAPSGSGPGIMAWPKGVAMPDTAHALKGHPLMKALVSQQTVYCNHQFQEGERLAIRGEMKQITEPMRVSGRWLGKIRPWMESPDADALEKCPICTEHIPSGAYKCLKCGSFIRELPPELRQLQAQVAKPPAPPTPATTR